MQSVGRQFFLSVLIRCYYKKYFRHHNNNNGKKRKTYRPVAGQKHSHKQVVLRIFKRMVPSKLLSVKKEVSGTFSFTCQVTALPVSYRRRVALCTALSTSPPAHPGLPATTGIDLRCRSLASRAKRSFYFGPPKINGSNSKLSLF